MIAEPFRLMEIDGFYWRRDWVELDKTVFNVTPLKQWKKKLYYKVRFSQMKYQRIKKWKR